MGNGTVDYNGDTHQENPKLLLLLWRPTITHIDAIDWIETVHGVYVCLCGSMKLLIAPVTIWVFLMQ